MLKYILLTKSDRCPYKKAYGKFLGIKLLGQSISKFFRFLTVITNIYQIMLVIIRDGSFSLYSYTKLTDF